MHNPLQSRRLYSRKHDNVIMRAEAGRTQRHCPSMGADSVVH